MSDSVSQTAKSYFQTEVERLYREDPVRPEQYAKVRQSKAFMESFYADKVELDDLAKAAFMSRFHYNRMFQRIYGLSPRSYLRDLRIAKAKVLLKQGLTITQVCFEVGYESVTTFSNVFKKCTGHSPRSFQKSHQQLQKSNLE